MAGTLRPLLLIALAAQEIVVPVPLVMPAIDWATLPDLPYRQPPHMTAPMHSYVKGQVRARKCRARRLVDGRPAVRIEVAVLVSPEDGVRASVARAIGCATVEQYAAGLVSSFARNNLAARSGGAEQWYRATVTFVWAK